MARRVIAVFSAFLLLCAGFAAHAEEAYDWMVLSLLTEPPYTQVSAAYTLPAYGGAAVVFPADIDFTVGQSAAVSFTAPESALYTVWLTYENTAGSILPTELTATLDGALPFFEMRRISLGDIWADDGTIPLDRYGNELAPELHAKGGLAETGLSDSAGRTAEPFLFSLDEGEHTLSLTVNDGAARVTALSLKAPETTSAYQKNEATGSALIIIEGERIASRSSSDIRAASEFNASITPYSTDKRVLNHLADASFNKAGDSVTYTFDAAEAGFYNMGLNYRQQGKADFPVFLDIRIDGAFASGAAKQVKFPYTREFKDITVSQDGSPQTFYLAKGTHTLTFTINAEPLTPIYEEIEALIRSINSLALEITRLTGGDRSDIYRDYSLETYIPGLPALLIGWAERCDAIADSMRPLSENNSDAAFSQIVLCASQLRALSKKPEELPRRLSELNSGATSVTRMLAQQLQDLADNALGIDQIYFYQEDARLPERVGALTSVVGGAARFIRSFGAQEYAAENKSERLQVWMARPRQYVELLQNLIDTDFTPQTGIEVDLSIMPDAGKLVLANAAGTGPDAVLSVQYVLPSYLDIRGALYDLTQFDDFGEIAARFPTGMFTPYILEGGVYALPETVNFWVMFYRKDIFDALSIPLPNTMDDVKAILPELQRRSMNFFYPTAGMVGLKVFPGTLPLILQSGGGIYGETADDTTLDSEASLAGFRELTDLFTVYNLPADVPAPGFYQQFRDGTLPIGISDLATYNLLLNAAPELEGLWDIAVFPGLTDESGEVQRWTTGGAETMGIFSTTKRADESWTFLKWWSSAAVQGRFGSLLQSTYGEEYIWPTANIEAFAKLPLKSSHKAVITEQMSWMTEAPWVLGTYMLERELSNAYLSVIVDGVDARRALDTAIKRINRETYRKLEEFGYYKGGVMVRQFITPNADVVRKYINDANMDGGSE
ncbi:MAG: extracellular solute-binding protein [Oscillospiraceae bacterium]|jgi:ABC-type glycerol-3-phosphate transport system substrate-binding protein|nr:extracellular solute-binding protein [Oscillospiraceae bacterium]